MIRSSDRLTRFERRFAREHALSHEQALALFTALWMEARQLDPAFPRTEDWRDDIEPDLAVARAVNGLPPAP